MSAFAKGFLIFVGSGVGANLRFWAGELLAKFPESQPFWATFVVNVIGSFCIGLLMGSAPKEMMRLLFGVGLLGGFTTFSSFSMETINLFAAKQTNLALTYVLGSTLLSLLLCWVGIWAIRR